MLERGIADEAQRILLAAKTNVAEARSSLDALRLKAVAERANVFTDNEAQVRLRDLEQTPTQLPRSTRPISTDHARSPSSRQSIPPMCG